MPHGRPAGARQGWAMWQTHDAVLTSSSVSHPIARASATTLSWERARQDTPELMHGLALTNFLDCNTRHFECSTCFVSSLETQPNKPNSCNNNNNETRRYWMETTTQIDINHEKWYLVIYLNSLVLYLCLYTVNSATLQRITFKQTLKNFERC